MSELNGIYEHLNELRTRVLRVVIVIGVIAIFLMTFHLETMTYNDITFYYPSPEPLDNIAAQLTNYFKTNLVPEGVQLIQTAPGQAFFAQVYIAALVGIVAGTPVIIREVVNFLKPALKENEVNVGRAITVPITGLFVSGCLFAYFVVIPFMLDFFVQIWCIVRAYHIFEYNGFCYICFAISFGIWIIVSATSTNVCI